MYKMNQEIWKANHLDDVDISNMSDGHLISIIEMFAKRTNPPPILYELIEVAYTRGIDLDNKYNKENKEKRDKEKKESGVPDRIAVLYDTDPKDKTLTERVITTGRTTINDLFIKSNVLSSEKLRHHPFIVFRDDGDFMNVIIVNNAKGLLEFSDETKVMVQWKGKWTSDFFHFIIGDLKKYLKENDVTIDELIEREKIKEEEKKLNKMDKMFSVDFMNFPTQ